MKKTLKGWNKSGLELDQYMPEPCEIDEGLHLYIGEIVPPKYCTRDLIQGGDAEKSELSYYDDEEIYYYMTTSEVNDKYFYLGILPEFRQ